MVNTGGIMRHFVNNYRVNNKLRNYLVSEQSINNNNSYKVTSKMVGQSFRPLFFNTPELAPGTPTPFDLDLIWCFNISKIIAVNLFKPIFEPFLVSHEAIIAELL